MDACTYDWCTDKLWLQQLRHFTSPTSSREPLWLSIDTRPPQSVTPVAQHTCRRRQGMAPTSFEGAFGNVALISKTRAALEASCDEDWCRQSASELKLLEAVLSQMEVLSPTTASDETVRIVRLCRLACAPHLECFLHGLEKLQPDLDHYFVAGGHRPDVEGPPLWVTAVEKNTTTLMTNVGMQLQLANALLRVESLRIITATNNIQQSSRISPDPLSLASAIKAPPQQCIMSGNGNMYQGVYVNDGAKAHLGNSYSFLGVPKASVDKLSEKLKELATSRQADALQTLLIETQKKQSDGSTVLSLLDSRTGQVLEQLRQIARLIATENPSLPKNAKIKRLRRATQERQAANLLEDLSSIIEIIRVWLSTIIMMLLMGSRSVQDFIRSARTLIRPPSMLLDSNIMVIDALNRPFSLPYEHFRRWPLMLAHLQCEFKGLPGESYVANLKFGLFRAAKNPRNQLMIPFEQWERSVFPGDRFLMSIDLEQFDPNECPSCGSALREVHLIPVFSEWSVFPVPIAL
jgi:hypothetical protein